MNSYKNILILFEYLLYVIIFSIFILHPKIPNFAKIFLAIYLSAILYFSLKEFYNQKFVKFIVVIHDEKKNILKIDKKPLSLIEARERKIKLEEQYRYQNNYCRAMINKKVLIKKF